MLIANRPRLSLAEAPRDAGGWGRAMGAAAQAPCQPNFTQADGWGGTLGLAQSLPPRRKTFAQGKGQALPRCTAGQAGRCQGLLAAGAGGHAHTTGQLWGP